MRWERAEVDLQCIPKEESGFQIIHCYPYFQSNAAFGQNEMNFNQWALGVRDHCTELSMESDA